MLLFASITWLEWPTNSVDLVYNMYTHIKGKQKLCQKCLP